MRTARGFAVVGIARRRRTRAEAGAEAGGRRTHVLLASRWWAARGRRFCFRDLLPPTLNRWYATPNSTSWLTPTMMMAPITLNGSLENTAHGVWEGGRRGGAGRGDGRARALAGRPAAGAAAAGVRLVPAGVARYARRSPGVRKSSTNMTTMDVKKPASCVLAPARGRRGGSMAGERLGKRWGRGLASCTGLSRWHAAQARRSRRHQHRQPRPRPTHPAPEALLTAERENEPVVV